jgi:hypothetical protein
LITGEERLWGGVVGVCLLASGVILIGAAVPTARYYYRFFRRSRRVVGRVVDHENAGGSQYRAVIEYQADGQTHRYRDEVRSDRPPRVGSRVDVRTSDSYGSAQRGGLVLFVQMVVAPPFMVFIGAGILFGGYWLLRRTWTGQ